MSASSKLQAGAPMPRLNLPKVGGTRETWRAAICAGTPNAVTDEDFTELKRYYTDAQIVDIVAVIALFGFLNRFNDTMATELESSPVEAGQRFLAQKGWSVGKHAG